MVILLLVLDQYVILWACKLQWNGERLQEST